MPGWDLNLCHSCVFPYFVQFIMLLSMSDGQSAATLMAGNVYITCRTESCVLLEGGTASLGNDWCPAFWESYSSHLHRSICSKRTHKIRPPPAGCPKPLVTCYPVMQGHIPDEMTSATLPHKCTNLHTCRLDWDMPSIQTEALQMPVASEFQLLSRCHFF